MRGPSSLPVGMRGRPPVLVFSAASGFCGAKRPDAGFPLFSADRLFYRRVSRFFVLPGSLKRFCVIDCFLRVRGVPCGLSAGPSCDRVLRGFASPGSWAGQRFHWSFRFRYSPPPSRALLFCRLLSCLAQSIKKPAQALIAHAFGTRINPASGPTAQAWPQIFRDLGPVYRLFSFTITPRLLGLLLSLGGCLFQLRGCRFPRSGGLLAFLLPVSTLILSRLFRVFPRPPSFIIAPGLDCLLCHCCTFLFHFKRLFCFLYFQRLLYHI